jgi:light-regulated signal transduction histidine kinase (bacteriophytochrome)
LEAAIGDFTSDLLQLVTLNNGAIPDKIYQPIGAGGRLLHLQAHRTGRHICVDIEPGFANGEQTLSIMASQSLLGTLRQATSSEQLCVLAVNALRTFSGYDRVIALRFADDGHGEVIAESRAEHLEPYLGLHYPTADIPARARRLYLKQRVGSVADTSYQAVPLLAEAASNDGVPLDLTYSSLRSISPIALDYARDMGTAASLSTLGHAVVPPHITACRGAGTACGLRPVGPGHLDANR